MNLSLIGPSGAGKGTLIPALQARFNLMHVSTGDLLRDNLEHNTALGQLAKKFMAQGELVPDDVVNAMIQGKVQKTPASEGILFDGFPRTIQQAKFLERIMTEKGRRLDAVIYMNASDREIERRLSGRLICRLCLAPFHRTLRRFTECPHHKCSGEHLYQRADDTPEMIRIRLRMFHRVIRPLLQYYQHAGLLLILNAERDPAEVSRALLETASAVQAGRARFATIKELARFQPAPEFLPRTEIRSTRRVTMDLVLLGAPGCGKGTQAEALSKHFHLRHISTGALFREHLKTGTELGRLAKGYLDEGDLVPDDITDAMMMERLSQPDTAGGFLLDGYPRTHHQAEALDEMLASLGRKLAGVLYIDVPDAEIVTRLSGRVVCRVCQTPYHLKFKPPATPGLCDHCGCPLCQREDDKPETVHARLRTFHEQTEPLIDYYRREKLLVQVKGNGDLATVTAGLVAAVKSLSGASFKQISVVSNNTPARPQ